jgi:hypothetical protein
MPQPLLIPTFALALTVAAATTHAETARGVVFHDQNHNGSRESQEPGIANVRVSNGVDIVSTDNHGKYALEVNDDTILFVLKPRNWSVPVDDHRLPQFYYIHKPAGSPDDSYQFAGVEPTGPLPSSIDFPLTPIDEPEEFSIVLMGDPQPYSREEVRFYANDVIAELVDANAAFGISLGDIVGNTLSLFEHVNAVQAKVGIPWYNVHGNHDINFHSPNDQYADETFERVYGPANFAFQCASVHFIVLDNVQWNGSVDANNDGEPDEGNYVGALHDNQIEFVANYVAEVPRTECVVICTHIPLISPDDTKYGTPQLARLLEILANHPHQLSFSAHTHYIRNDFVGGGDGHSHPHDHGPDDLHTDHRPGVDGHHHHFQIHHHHNTATGSGSWYRGPKDEQGFPMTPMRDGVPNGYVIATFTANRYKLRYKAARMPSEYQMAIHAPDSTAVSEVGDTEILANVFNGNKNSTVKMRVRGVNDWIPMTKTHRKDPAYIAMFERDLADKDRPHRALPDPIATPHMWVANLPDGILPGVHILEVESTDMFGQIDRGIRLLEVDPDPPVAEAPATTAQRVGE